MRARFFFYTENGRSFQLKFGTAARGAGSYIILRDFGPTGEGQGEVVRRWEVDEDFSPSECAWDLAALSMRLHVRDVSPRTFSDYRVVLTLLLNLNKGK